MSKLQQERESERARERTRLYCAYSARSLLTHNRSLLTHTRSLLTLTGSLLTHTRSLLTHTRSTIILCVFSCAFSSLAIPVTIHTHTYRIHTHTYRIPAVPIPVTIPARGDTCDNTGCADHHDTVVPAHGRTGEEEE